MNILRIARKEVLQDIRDRWTLIFMLAFPIVLMMVLGFALSNAFDSGSEIDKIHVLVKDTGENEALTRSFTAFSAETAKSGIQFEDLKAGMDGKEEVKKGHYADYVELTKNGIELYSSSFITVEHQILQGTLTAFTEKYKMISTVVKLEPDKIGIVSDGTTAPNYIQETSLVPDRKPGALDYYALAMTAMVALWGAMSASQLISKEVKEGTAFRLVAAPVNKVEIFVGKVLGNLVVNMLCVLVLIFFSKYAFGAYWGDHLLVVILLLLSLVIMAVSLGLAVSYMFKEAASRSILMLVTQLAAVFGGAYFPFDEAGLEMTKLMSFIIRLSPIRWTNSALTGVVYRNEIVEIWPVFALNIGIAAVMLTIAALLMRRREGL
ncbi:ABC transporter permease [Paenibacillus sp. D2_2]|uniref:ABC transporter permease n=1 Tax=Paenibacillus sp. D2_2 TaxID=3073092 RepID=UPI002816582F|nr:ABC transporter permease [Paenibacillus sp. D2_2]WMT42391.1 ABC transporter permease [Paenibacillus sp. D2_2]